MKIEDILLELGNTWYNYHVTSKNEDYVEVRAEEAGLTVYLAENFGYVSIEFSINGRLDLTGGGDAFKILSTVKRILTEHLPDFAHHSNEVAFFASNNEPSRIKLYQRIVPVISGILGNGWTHQQSQVGNHEEFTWKRQSIKEDQLDLFPSKIYYVMINGRIWKKDGQPVEFKSYREADRAAISIIDRYGKPAQVIDPERYPVKNR